MLVGDEVPYVMDPLVTDLENKHLTILRSLTCAAGDVKTDRVFFVRDDAAKLCLETLIRQLHRPFKKFEDLVATFIVLGAPVPTLHVPDHIRCQAPSERPCAV